MQDSAAVFPVHVASAVADPLSQHHVCQCTVAQPSDCDAGQRSGASTCYVAQCPTGQVRVSHHPIDCLSHQPISWTACMLSLCVRAFHPSQPDGYRGCTCAWARHTDHSPPHGCTAEIHCAIASGEPLPANCSSGAVWSAPNSSQLLYSWDPRGNDCLNATINCVSGAQPLNPHSR